MELLQRSETTLTRRRNIPFRRHLHRFWKNFFLESICMNLSDLFSKLFAQIWVIYFRNNLKYSISTSFAQNFKDLFLSKVFAGIWVIYFRNHLRKIWKVYFWKLFAQIWKIRFRLKLHGYERFIFEIISRNLFSKLYKFVRFFKFAHIWKIYFPN